MADINTRVKLCPACGDGAPVDAQFCPVCGHRFFVEAPEVIDVPFTMEQQPRRFPFRLSALGAVAAALLVFVLWPGRGGSSLPEQAEVQVRPVARQPDAPAMPDAVRRALRRDLQAMVIPL